MAPRLSDASSKTLTTLMFIWLAMVGALFVYGIVCYMLLTQGSIKVMYSPDILRTTAFMGVNLLLWLYIAAALVLAGGFMHFKSSYAKAVAKMMEQTFESADDEFNAFKTQYTTLMFVHLATFESIAIVGIVVFLTTGDFTTLINLITLALVGFVLVMPSKAKFEYRR